MAGPPSIAFIPVPLPAVTAIKFVAIFCVIITWIAVSLRFWTRSILLKQTGWDDWFILAALILSFGFDGCILGMLLQRNPENPILTAKDMTVGIGLLLAAESFYIWCMIFIKISLGIFFLRILVHVWPRRIVYFMMGLSSITGFAYFWYAVFQCGLPNAGGTNLWEKRLALQCNITPLKANASGYLHGAVQVLTDIAFVLVPLPMIRDSRMTGREKLSVFFIFGTAVSGCIASIVRLVYIPALSDQKANFWIEANSLGIWSAIECGLSITAASCATLRPLLRILTEWFHSNISRHKLTRSTSKSSGSIATPLRFVPGIPRNENEMGNIPIETTTPVTSNTERQTFLFGNIVNTGSDVTRNPTSFHNTVSSMDSTMNETFGPLSNGSGLNGNVAGHHPLQSHPTDQQEDLESGRIAISRANRATWFPVSRSSILEEQTVYQPNSSIRSTYDHDSESL